MPAMSRGDEVTKLLNELKPMLERLNGLLGMDRVQYEMISGDQEALFIKNRKLLEENKIIEMRNGEMTKMSEKIIETAKEEAQNILNRKYEVIVKAQQMMEEVKQFCISIDKKRWNDMDRKVADMKAAV